MKKTLLLGLVGVLIMSNASAQISSLNFPEKSASDPVSAYEFNDITSAINEVTEVFTGVDIDGSGKITGLDLNDTSVTKLTAPEFCINTDCITAWPAGGSGVTALTCASGEQLQAVDASGVFTCGTDISGGSGADLTDVTSDILPNMTGATGVISTRNIGAADKWFGNLWVEDLHVGNNTIRMGDDGAEVLSRNSGKIILSSQSEQLDISSLSEDLSMKIAGGLDKDILIQNDSTGDINIATLAGLPGANTKISVTAPTVRLADSLAGTSKVGINLLPTTVPTEALDIRGNINFTGDLYKEGNLLNLNFVTIPLAPADLAIESQANGFTVTWTDLSTEAQKGYGTISTYKVCVQGESLGTTCFDVAEGEGAYTWDVTGTPKPEAGKKYDIFVYAVNELGAGVQSMKTGNIFGAEDPLVSIPGTWSVGRWGPCGAEKVDLNEKVEDLEKELRAAEQMVTYYTSGAGSTLSSSSESLTKAVSLKNKVKEDVVLAINALVDSDISVEEAVSVPVGIQFRSVLCLSEFGSLQSEVYCAGTERPKSSQTCKLYDNEVKYTYSWITGDWSDCAGKPESVKLYVSRREKEKETADEEIAKLESARAKFVAQANENFSSLPSWSSPSDAVISISASSDETARVQARVNAKFRKYTKAINAKKARKYEKIAISGSPDTTTITDATKSTLTFSEAVSIVNQEVNDGGLPYKYRDVSCQRSDKKIVEDSFCESSNELTTFSSSRPVSMMECELEDDYEWRLGKWSPCGPDADSSIEIVKQKLEKKYTKLETAKNNIAVSTTTPVLSKRRTGLEKAALKVKEDIEEISAQIKEAYLVTSSSARSGATLYSSVAKNKIPIRTRDVDCVHINTGKVVEDSFCTDKLSSSVSARPASVEDCTLTKVTYDWEVGEWGNCGNNQRVANVIAAEKSVQQSAAAAVTNLTQKKEQVLTAAGLSSSLSRASLIDIVEGTPMTVDERLEQIAAIEAVALIDDISHATSVASRDVGVSGGGFMSSTGIELSTVETALTSASLASPVLYRARKVSCSSSLGGIVADKYCSETEKPVIIEECTINDNNKVSAIVDGNANVMKGVNALTGMQNLQTDKHLIYLPAGSFTPPSAGTCGMFTPQPLCN